MDQPKASEIKEKYQIVCKLKKSTYELKQASRKWYIMFNNIITYFGSKKITIDPRIYQKICRSKYTFLVMHVDDILLVANDLGIIAWDKRFSLYELWNERYEWGILCDGDRNIQW